MASTSPKWTEEGRGWHTGMLPWSVFSPLHVSVVSLPGGGATDVCRALARFLVRPHKRAQTGVEAKAEAGAGVARRAMTGRAEEWSEAAEEASHCREAQEEGPYPCAHPATDQLVHVHIHCLRWCVPCEVAARAGLPRHHLDRPPITRQHEGLAAATDPINTADQPCASSGDTDQSPDLSVSPDQPPALAPSPPHTAVRSLHWSPHTHCLHPVRQRAAVCTFLTCALCPEAAAGALRLLPPELLHAVVRWALPWPCACQGVGPLSVRPGHVRVLAVEEDGPESSAVLSHLIGRLGAPARTCVVVTRPRRDSIGRAESSSSEWSWGKEAPKGAWGGVCRERALGGGVGVWSNGTNSLPCVRLSDSDSLERIFVALVGQFAEPLGGIVDISGHADDGRRCGMCSILGGGMPTFLGERSSENPTARRGRHPRGALTRGAGGATAEDIAVLMAGWGAERERDPEEAQRERDETAAACERTIALGARGIVFSAPLEDVAPNFVRLLRHFHHTVYPRLLDNPRCLPQAQERYERYLLLLSRHPHEVIVPPRDVHALWISSLIRPSQYEAHCIELLGACVEHYLSADIWDRDMVARSARIWESTQPDSYAEFGAALLSSIWIDCKKKKKKTFMQAR
eukprot:TRINITY_DN238_c0_g1_i1.p1 TRINITY_DN238_c0_g1~~TRINITY_DN238_c0_g1_i1.p1  ORF type:complete len:629 (-),score=120.93 TRINITY_DN238_c0_g1_i1:617-2503(-)